MPVKEAAKLWDLTERRVSSLCKDGKIKGARKQGHSWLIPADAQKPVDNRIRTGAYKKAVRPVNLPLPIGISDYRLASTEYYYVDKTLMLRDFIDERPMVSLFTRPRRFSKTLNMDMFRTFFEKTVEDTSTYFRDKKIWACGNKYHEYQGKYPVIFLTLKDAKKDTWPETFRHITQVITLEYKRHFELADSAQVQDKDYYQEIINGKADESLFDSSLYILSKMLHEHYGIAPIIIIDEYDTPIQQGYEKGFYDEIVLFMRNLFSGCFKDNRHLSYGFLTGVLCAAKETIFSEFNNLTVNSIFDNKYSEYFGFTPDEVREMARYYQAEDKYEEICEWFDGYRFGNKEIFSPWSVINYFRNSCQLGSYWQSTGRNEFIGEILSEADSDIYGKLNALLQGKSITSYIDTSVIYPQVKSNPSTIFSYLMVTGYLKVISSEISFNGDFICKIAIPNKEISYLYRKEILKKLSGLFPQASIIALQEAICSGSKKDFKYRLQELLLRAAENSDAFGENFCSVFLLGISAFMEPYEISLSRESGSGRYNMQLKPQTPHLPGILIELKAARNCSSEKLKHLSQKALAQMIEKKYDSELKADGITDIIRYGIAFCGKEAEIAVSGE
jgi:hypothetical protein